MLSSAPERHTTPGELVRVRRSGVELEVRTRPRLVGAVTACLPPGAEPAERLRRARSFTLDRVRDEYVLTGPRGELWRSQGVEEALERLQDSLRFEVACRSSEHLFVHAGAVAVNGRGILLPGASGAGKSHLVAALVRRGARYYSDEFALIDRRGRLHAYAQPIALGAAPDRPKRQVRVEDLGGRPGSEALPVALIASLRFRRGASFRPRPLTAGESVLALFSHTVRARCAPAAALSRLRAVAERARGLKGERGEADRAAEALLDRLDSSTKADKEVP